MIDVIDRQLVEALPTLYCFAPQYGHEHDREPLRDVNHV